LRQKSNMALCFVHFSLVLIPTLHVKQGHIFSKPSHQKANRQCVVQHLFTCWTNALLQLFANLGRSLHAFHLLEQPLQRSGTAHLLQHLSHHKHHLSTLSNASNGNRHLRRTWPAQSMGRDRWQIRTNEGSSQSVNASIPVDVQPPTAGLMPDSDHHSQRLA
jgi:hypothetical protein